LALPYLQNLPSFIEPIKSCSPGGYKGVYLQGKKYVARIYYENSSFGVGSFASKVDAAKMYGELKLVLGMTTMHYPLSMCLF
jgi:hypothetical protein